MAGTVEIDKREIRVDGNPVQILSGAMHYFRIHPDYWRDRIVKLRQCEYARKLSGMECA